MPNTPFLSVFRASGDDHASFLQGQLTQDVQLLSETRPAMLSACCDAKGRVIALLTLIHAPESILIAVRTDIAEVWRNHILRYRMRARVDIEAESELALTAQLSSGNNSGFDLLSHQGQASGSVWSLGGLTEQLSADTSEAAGMQSDEWQTQRIMAGVADVGPTTTGAYTPHMLGMTALHAVSFEKGCYTGQEIVARTEHRGAAKRRPIRLQAEQRDVLLEGESVMAAGKKVGSIAAAAPTCAIAVVSDFDGNNLETESGHALTVV